MISRILIFIFLFCLTVFVGANDNNRKVHLENYLKSKYVGKKITVSSSGDNISRMRLKVVNVVKSTTKGKYNLILSNKDKAVFHFVSSTKGRLRVDKNSKKEKMLQVNTLKAQELINQAIEKTMSQTESTSSLSSLRNLEENMHMYFEKNNFTTSKKIIYTDPREKKSQEDYFIVTTNGLYLMDGRKIMIYIEGT